MPSLFIFELNLTSGFTKYEHVHQYDNGYLICYGDWSEFVVEQLMLEDSETFFLSYDCTCKLVNLRSLIYGKCHTVI